MPVVTLESERFSKFVGRNISTKEMEKWLPWLGVDIEETGTDYVKIEVNPNRIDFASYAGLARAFCGIMGWKTGLPEYKVKRGNIALVVEPKVKKIRPYVVGAVIRDLKLNDDTVKELMKIQEDLHWGVGRNRRKVSIGVHNLNEIQPPFTYSTVLPESVRFTPLDSTEEMNLREILERHEKGKMFGYLIQKAQEYPIIFDKEQKVLSFPPIINGELTRVDNQTKDLFIDVTGTDLTMASRSLNILVVALAEMGGFIESIQVKYPSQPRLFPELDPQRMILRLDYARGLLGMDLSESDIIESLKKSRLGVRKVKHGVLEIMIPPYRIDIMHEVDLVEEISLGYGFYRIEPRRPSTLTRGIKHEVSQMEDYVQQIMIGLGFLEVMNFVLTNEENQYSKMNVNPKNPITLANPVSGEYSIIRENLLASLMKILAENRHESYPQKIFEVSDIIKTDYRKETLTKRRLHVAAVSCHIDSSFTEIKSYVEALLINLNVDNWRIKNKDHASFIAGRSASIYMNHHNIGILGEIHPQVLNNFDVENPTSAFELDLKEILDE
jgi:phenylalanyl-tRNA synthetase beta chain